MEQSTNNAREPELDVMLRFLKLTKEGAYVEIRETEMSNIRVVELAQPVYYCGEEFIYGIS
jgi:hypothetical protein